MFKAFYVEYLYYADHSVMLLKYKSELFYQSM